MTTIKKVVVPDLGGATDVTVIEVLVKSGDHINVDDPIVTLESDKATLEVPSNVAGVVTAVNVKVNDKLSSGAVLLTLETEATSSPVVERPSEEKPTATRKKSASRPRKAKAAAPKKTEIPEASEESEAVRPVLTGTVQSMSDVHAGPGVRRFARELGVDLSQIPGSGPKQRILKEDVQGFVKTQLSQVQSTSLPMLFPEMPVIDFAKFGAVEAKALSRIKKISGKNLQRNWMMMPHVTQFGEADITALEDFRQSQKAELEKQNVKFTPLVFVMKAVVASLKAFPQFNASLDATGENLIMKKYFHLGVAVDTVEGLVVPVIREVDKKGLVDLAKELAEVSEKARHKKLMPQDMQGGCFSISSLGGIGGTFFTPIINYPEVAILGISKTAYKPVYQDGAFVPRLMLPLALSYDHRVVDGADGARFIVHLINMLSDIRNLLL